METNISIYGLSPIGDTECCSIVGGRDEDIAKVVEIVAQCLGILAKAIYITMTSGSRRVSEQMSAGYYPKF